MYVYLRTGITSSTYIISEYINEAITYYFLKRISLDLKIHIHLSKNKYFYLSTLTLFKMFLFLLAF
jgi:hypothetical protein